VSAAARASVSQRIRMSVSRIKIRKVAELAENGCKYPKLLERDELSKAFQGLMTLVAIFFGYDV
jgi:hypothetical protein